MERGGKILLIRRNGGGKGKKKREQNYWENYLLLRLLLLPSFPSPFCSQARGRASNYWSVTPSHTIIIVEGTAIRGATQGAQTLFLLFVSPFPDPSSSLLKRVVQRRSTKIIPSWRTQPCDERLKRLNLSYWERGDWERIWYWSFKYLNKFNNLDHLVTGTSNGPEN